MPASTSTESDTCTAIVPAWVLAVAIAVTGCTSDAPTTDRPRSVPPEPAAAAVSTPPVPAVPTGPAPQVDLWQSFAAVAAQIPGRVSVSVVSGSEVHTFGDVITGPAWSTIKVPVAIAALREAPAEAASHLSAAIARSDNHAAEGLWTLLGPPADAARSVESVLRDAGDSATIVQSERIRAGFTAFGQTSWATAAQAAFAWRLPCVSGSDEVVAEMEQIVPEQRWGFAGDEGAAAKGGWGPGPDGAYLVRQLALLRDEAGSIGIAMAAVPDDETFESGVSALDKLADWIDSHREDFRWADCRMGAQ